MQRRQFIKGSAILGFTIAHSTSLLGESGLYQISIDRKVRRILTSDKVSVGTLPVMRAFAGNHVDHVSPFILLDEFGPSAVPAGSEPLRVNAHPHAGVTPTTYFMSGSGHHKDSLDYDFQIEKGDFMLFSSGRGAIHMEESGQSLVDEGGQYHGFQIWLNTPAKYKFEAPETFVFRNDRMDTIIAEQYSIKVILGKLWDAQSNVRTLTPAYYYHIKLRPNARIDIPIDARHNAFAYQIAGTVELAGQKLLKPTQLALFEREGDQVSLFSKLGAELLLLGGEPLNEPVFSYGPFVMNSREQIKQCIVDYRAGKMGNPDLVNL
jgi:hypothetical protein